MQRRDALILLAVLGAGAFLTGLELMVTAVALPAIVTDLASWAELRRASWIVQAYLLVYVTVMPLAGRLSDLWGARRLFLAALTVFTFGSLLAGLAQSLDQLIAARVVQALGGGALVPVATAAASHLFEGHARPRALGVVGALTFLGMAAGPFLGAVVLQTVRVEPALLAAGITSGPLPEVLAPAWRWVFYVNVPIGIAAIAVAWAASAGWETPRHAARVDAVGAVLFTISLGAGLIGITLIGGADAIVGIPPVVVIVSLLAISIAAGLASIVRGLRAPEPFVDPRLFRDRVFSSAAIVSLLTGYGFATAIIGAAVFVDRVLYGGPSQQEVALGSLAAATAVGALASGFLIRIVSLRVVTLVGLIASTIALIAMSTWLPSTTLLQIAVATAVFGLGFGLTVTPRSTAAVESAGRRAFGAASAAVTVARMIGMALGLAILTAYGSTTIDRLNASIFATPEAYRSVIPVALRARPLRDGLVVQALETWAAGQAAGIMVGLFLVAAGLTLVAVPAGLALGSRPRMLASRRPEGIEGAMVDAGAGSDDRDDGRVEPIAL